MDLCTRESITLDVGGVRIAGEIYVPGGGAAGFPVLCICHGIPSGNAPDPADGGYPVLAEKFCRAGFTTVIFNFRGTGASGGDFDMIGWAGDLSGVLDYVCSLPQVDQAAVCVMGFSGGAAVSAYVAANDPRIDKVVLCACPAEFRGLIDDQAAGSSVEHFRRLGMIRDEGFPSSLDEWALGFQRVAPAKWIDRISPRPLLLVHGTEDDVVDPSQALRLYEMAKEPKELALVEGAGHRLRLSDRAMDLALEWLR